MTKDKSIFIKNIYYMLSYAFSILRQAEDDKIAVEEFENIHNLFAAILSKGISRQLKQGLYREYMNRVEDLTVMRGKINMPGTIRNRLQCRQRLTCEYDVLSENNLLNRVLKTTVMILLQYGDVDSEYKNVLKKAMLFFSNVDEIDPFLIRWSSIHFQRNSQAYRVLLSICRLIIEGMLLTTDDGEYKLASFIDDQRMSHLYEKFILEYYIAEHKELDAAAAQIPWSLDNGVGTLLPIMQSDVMLSDKGKHRILTIDAKYYTHSLAENRFDKYTIHSGNLYQIFTYVKNLDTELKDHDHTVSGMLLYAKTDEELYPDNVYQMSGNEISVRTLDLNQDFSKIRAQLDGIVDEYFGGADEI